MAIKVEVETGPGTNVWNDYTTLVLLDSLRITSSGGAQVGTAECTIRDAAGTAVVSPECGLRVTDGTTVIHRGPIKKRGKNERMVAPTSRKKEYGVLAQDCTAYLVDDVIDAALVRTGSRSDKSEVEYLITTYGTKGITVGATVQTTGTIDRDIDYTGLNLYEALVEAAKWLGVRFYVGYDMALHWYVTETNSAPFNLSDAPNGSTTFGYQGFDYPDDSLDLVNAVWVVGQGGTAEWVPPTATWPTASHTAYGRKEATLRNDELDTSAKRQSAGMDIINRQASPRGPIKVTVFQPGLRSDQNIQITNSVWGLSAVTFRIQDVVATVNSKTNSLKYEVTLQDAPVDLPSVIAGGFTEAKGDIDRSVNNAVAYAEQFLIGRVRVVTVLPTLPDANYPIGSQVFLTADEKIYRNPDDAAWTPSIFLPDGLGQISTTQIADDAISTPKVQAGAIQTDHLAAGAVTADQIAANTIVAGNIAAGAIGAEALAAEIVLGDKLITTGLPGSPRVELDDSGMRAYDASEKVVVNIPTNSVDPVSVIGKIETGDLTSTASAELRGAIQLAAGSVTALQLGIVDPVAAPTVAVDTPLKCTLASAPAQPGYGIAYDASGYGAVPTIWIGANPATGNLLDMAYEYNASTGALLRTLRKTGTTTTATATLGSTSHIADTTEASSGTTNSQIATPLTMPRDGRVTKVSAYIGGYGGSASCRMHLWDTSGGRYGNGYSNSFTVASRAFTNGNDLHYNEPLIVPAAISAGTTFWAGFVRNSSSEGFFWSKDDGSGKVTKKGDGLSGSMTSISTDSDSKPNIYVTYEYDVDSSVEGVTGKIVGVVRAGSYVFCLDANGVLFQYNQSDLTYVGKTDLSSYMGGNKANAGMFYDGTNLIITTATGTTGTDQVRLVKANATTRAYVSTVNCTGFAFNGSTGYVRGGFWDGTNWDVNVNGTSRVFLNSTSAYNGGGWDFGVSTELTYGLCGKSTTEPLAWGSASITKIWAYTQFDQSNGSDRAFWIGYSWYDSNAGGTGTHETKVGPIWTGTIGRRRRVTITTPAIPTASAEPPDRCRVYMYTAAPSAGQMWLQATDALTTRSLLSYTSSGTHDPSSNGFPPGSAAEIKSSASPGWSLKGDGSVSMLETSTNVTLTGIGTATFTVAPTLRWVQIGNLIFFRLYFVVNAAGSGTTTIASTLGGVVPGPPTDFYATGQRVGSGGRSIGARFNSSGGFLQLVQMAALDTAADTAYQGSTLTAGSAWYISGCYFAA